MEKTSRTVQRWWKLSVLAWDYIVRETLAPFVMALSVIMFVFLLQFLMRFIERIVGRGLSFGTIVELIVFNLAWMVVLAVPMAVLVACVMAFGSMAAANELTAMKAAGISLGRMIFPVLVLSTLIAVFDLQFNNIILPDANHRAKDLMMDIDQKKPSLIIKPGTFTTDAEIPGYSILARGLNPKTNDLSNVTIYDHSSPAESRVLTAKRGHVAFTPNFQKIILTLYDGELHEVQAQQPLNYRRGHFGEYIVQVPASGYEFMNDGESERSGRELSAHDLMIRVHADEASRAREMTSLKRHLVAFANALTSPIAPGLPTRKPVIPPPPGASGEHPLTTFPTRLKPFSTRRQPHSGPINIRKVLPKRELAKQIAKKGHRVLRKKQQITKKQRAILENPLERQRAIQENASVAKGILGNSPEKPMSVEEKMRAMFAPQHINIQNDEASISQTQADLDDYLVETHKKYAIPASCIIFALIGVPLGALAKRSGVGAGTGLSIGFFVLYWVFLIGGEKLADRAVITPFWGMWGGDLILLLIGIGLTWRAAVERPTHLAKRMKEFWSSKILRRSASS